MAENIPITMTIEEVDATQAIDDEANKYKKYVESQKKANKKYRENNRDKFRQISRNYYNNHKTDPVFQQRQRQKSLKSYYKRKQETNDENVILTSKL